MLDSKQQHAIPVGGRKPRSAGLLTAATYVLLLAGGEHMKAFAIILIWSASAFAQDKAATDAKPAAPVIQDNGLWERTGLFHPFRRMPRFVLHDQLAIWTSPVHTAGRDIKKWAIFGGATAALVATDKWTVKQLPNSKSQVSVSNWGSRFGSAYALIPLSAGFYLIGSRRHDERFRETGLIAFETLIDANIVSEAIKLVADRSRPTEGDGKGHFLDGPNGRWNSSFPSGHATSTWALASVIAHEYPSPLVKIIAYGLASTVVIARVGARRHFPGDVIAGAGIGWFTGDYVYRKRHNRELDRKPSAVRSVLSHVRIGASVE
jgi:membrane-associated phospholipid phosphatase